MGEETFQVGGLTKGQSVRLERLRKKLIYFVSSYDDFMLCERDPLTHRWLQVTMELAPKLHLVSLMDIGDRKKTQSKYKRITFLWFPGVKCMIPTHRYTSDQGSNVPVTAPSLALKSSQKRVS